MDRAPSHELFKLHFPRQDTPGYGDQLDLDASIRTTLDFVEAQNVKWLEMEQVTPRTRHPCHCPLSSRECPSPSKKMIILLLSIPCHNQSRDRKEDLAEMEDPRIDLCIFCIGPHRCDLSDVGCGG